MIKNFNVLQAPYIKVEAQVIPNSIRQGKNMVKNISRYVLAPSAKKIGTYIVNQIFGSEILTQNEGLNVSWLMPTLKDAIELAVYQKESFIYIHKYDDKIYLENIKKSDLYDIVQVWDKVKEAVIRQEFYKGDYCLTLERIIKIENKNSIVTFKAYVEENEKDVEIPISKYNAIMGTDYDSEPYVLPYEVLINIDLGQDFFADSRNLLNEEMQVINTMFDEVQKTRTRIAASQHYQTSDIVGRWSPANRNYDISTLTVNNLQDYFVLLPGDKDHQIFNFLQGEIRVQQYIEAFKFIDYQVIQMAGLSPASFGYEKDAYMNNANIDISKNASDMTVEAIKSQIKTQIDNLFINISLAQNALQITQNSLPIEISWDYGANEKFDDIKKLQVLQKIQGVSSIPNETKFKIIQPIIKKLIDDDFDEDEIKNLIEQSKRDNKEYIEYGEI